MKNIGLTLRSLRDERGYTLRQLAEKAQVPFSHLCNIENGKKTPGLDILDRISYALDIPISHVLLKAEMEKEVEESKRRLLKELQPYFRKIDSVAKQLYGPSQDDSNYNDDNRQDEIDTTPIIRGGGRNSLVSNS